MRKKRAGCSFSLFFSFILPTFNFHSIFSVDSLRLLSQLILFFQKTNSKFKKPILFPVPISFVSGDILYTSNFKALDYGRG